ncbi:MAG: protein kinase domain-containing protein [Rubrivivax sp.]
MVKPLPCPPDDWTEFSRLLDEALALPPEQRPHWLERLSGGPARLRPLLASVLTQAEAAAAAHRLESPQVKGDRALGIDAGHVIGPYTVLSLLGLGGMGSVWRARRSDGAYAREVALKLPHAQGQALGVPQRFTQERDILAGLVHPHIAQLWDAGVSQQGQPYIALELVEGLPITEAVRQQDMPLRSRLAVFLQVVEAVAYAHGQWGAHRDIKPANVLLGQDGRVKLLDFGIAKLLQPEGNAEGLTRESIPATPRYAAPEQRRGGAVTAATDVHGLGLLLHELLTDAPAWPAAAAAAAADSEPPLPSHCVNQPTLRRALQGDLDAIVHRALRHDPKDRYESAQALADDIQRYLQHKPVRARHITRWAVAGKWVRRHRIPASLGAALAVSVVAGTAAVWMQSQQAWQQARRAEAVKAFLVGVFRHADPRLPSDQPRGAISARQLLDLAAQQVDTDTAGDPPLRVELLGLITEIYGYLEEHERFQALHQRWLQAAESTHGSHHPATLDARLMQVWAEIYDDELDKARQGLALIEADLRSARLEDSLTAARLWLAKGEALKATPGARDQRLEALATASALFERHAPHSGEHLAALANIGHVHMAAERWASARDTLVSALAMARGKTRPEVQENVPTIQANLGIVMVELGDHQAALTLFSDSAAQTLRMFGARHGSYAHAVSHRARLLHRLGDQRAAHALWDSLALAASPEAAPWHAPAREHQATALLSEGRTTEALLMLQAVATRYGARPGRESDVRRIRGLLGLALAADGQMDAASDALRSAWEASSTHDAPGGAAWTLAHLRWARWLYEHGETASARQVLERLPQAEPSMPSASQGRARELTALLRREMDNNDARHARAAPPPAVTTPRLALWGL